MLDGLSEERVWEMIATQFVAIQTKLDTMRAAIMERLQPIVDDLLQLTDQHTAMAQLNLEHQQALVDQLTAIQTELQQINAGVITDAQLDAVKTQTQTLVQQAQSHVMEMQQRLTEMQTNKQAIENMVPDSTPIPSPEPSPSA